MKAASLSLGLFQRLAGLEIFRLSAVYLFFWDGYDFLCKGVKAVPIGLVFHLILGCLIMAAVTCEITLSLVGVMASNAEVCGVLPSKNVVVPNPAVKENSDLSFFQSVERFVKSNAIRVWSEPKSDVNDMTASDWSPTSRHFFRLDEFREWKILRPFYISALEKLPFKYTEHVIRWSLTAILNKHRIVIGKIFYSRPSFSASFMGSDRADIRSQSPFRRFRSMLQLLLGNSRGLSERLFHGLPLTKIHNQLTDTYSDHNYASDGHYDLGTIRPPILKRFVFVIFTDVSGPLLVLWGVIWPVWDHWRWQVRDWPGWRISPF
jgi:hypothetical protein